MSTFESIWQSIDNSGSIEPETERQINALIARASAYADARRFVDFFELFIDDGEYSAITYENLENGLFLFTDKGLQGFRERAAYNIGVWQVPRGKTTHMVSGTIITPDEGNEEVVAVSNFMVARTGEIEHTSLHASGQYVDRFVQADGNWKFASRMVLVDSNMLPGAFTDLL